MSLSISSDIISESFSKSDPVLARCIMLSAILRLAAIFSDLLMVPLFLLMMQRYGEYLTIIVKKI